VEAAASRKSAVAAPLRRGVDEREHGDAAPWLQHRLSELQVYEQTEELSAALNMAVDEALLEQASSPILRFYGWRRPSLSFGYFGRYSDVAEEAARREIVRRWTGGGIVFHGDDLTYSLILPRAHIGAAQSSRTIYSHVHGAIQRALSTAAEVALAAADAPKISDSCFANPVVADVLVSGRKIAGAAQRRTRAGLLHQGSIQYERLPADFAEAFAAELCSRSEADSLRPELLARAAEIASKKYATRAWLHRH
jgi:lipoate-protein ligase A